ncbi:MAG: heparinase II/III family protein [Candidatus Latescibacteria bacterium]|jgi:hypothetical protein|nr:heparinase II/III family protein [Candidatus Latescibacterota bacterium]
MKAHAVEHPVFPEEVAPDEIASLQKQVAPVMAFGPDEIAHFIVPRTTFFNVSCPNCDGGTCSDSDRWIWEVDEPDRMACKFCGMVFPNEAYPLDHETTVTDSAGVPQTYRYSRGDDGYKHYMDMRVENCRKVYIERAVGTLADLYGATGEEPYARQVLLILNRLAEVYPHYSPHGIESFATMAPQIHDIRMLPEPDDGLQPVPGLAQDLPDYEAPYPYCSGMRADGGDNWFYAEMPPHLAVAYDQVAGSEALPRLSDELGEDVGQRFEVFLRATANYARTFPIYLGNMDPSLIRGLATIGRVIGEPEFVHDALRRATMILDRQFYPDGIWREGSPSYHSQTVSGLRSCLEGPLKGYTDPDGYVNPEDGLHIEDLNAARDVPMLYESIDALAEMRLPGGRPLPIHDTWARPSQRRRAEESADKPFGTRLMWGLGQAMLGLGSGETGVQTSLHFSGSYGHAHADNLDLMVYAKGRELISDIGYTHTLLRPFSTSSMAHNLVVVDERSQEGADGRLVGWGVCEDVLRFCEAAAEASYVGVTSVYRRAVATVALPGGGAYVVDVFRVKGGSTHDWFLHGSADEDQTVSCSLPLAPMDRSLLPDGRALDRDELGPGQGWNPVRGDVNLLYGLFEDLSFADTDGAWTATFQCEGAGSPAVWTTVLDQSDTTVLAGTAPSIRRAEEMDADIWDFTMPVVIARRTGSNLASIFAAVHEPYSGRPRIREARRLELADGPADGTGIVCEGDGFRDYHLSGTDADASIRAADRSVEATARYAFVRVRDGEAEQMAMVDGTTVRFGDIDLTAPQAPSGHVTAVERLDAGDPRDALVVDADVDPRPGRPHERVIVEFGDGSTYGLAVREIVRESGRSAIVLAHRPGFALSEDGETATHTHHPHRRMPGRPRFRLPNLVMWERGCP